MFSYLPIYLLPGVDQARAAQQLAHSQHNRIKAGFSYRRTGNEDHVPARRDTLQVTAHRLTQATLRPVADDRTPNCAPGAETKAASVEVVTTDPDNGQRVSPGSSFPAHPLEIGLLAQAIMAAHHQESEAGGRGSVFFPDP